MIASDGLLTAPAGFMIYGLTILFALLVAVVALSADRGR